MRNLTSGLLLLSSLFFVLECGEIAPTPVARKIIISSDNSACNDEPIHEVDDGYALLYALGTKGVELLGYIASHGNTTVENAYSCAVKMLSMAERRDIPVFMGAKSREELGKITEAVEGMKEIVETYPYEVWIVTTGTVTDLASFIMNYPDIAQHVKGMLVMAGVIYGTNGLPPRDIINVMGDIEAVDYVLAHGVNLKIAPLDLTADFVVDYQLWKEGIENIDWEPAFYLFKQSENWVKVMSIVDGGFHPYDVVGLFALFYPSYIIRSEVHRYSVIKDPNDLEYTNFVIEDDNQERIWAETWFDVDEKAFWKTFRKALRIY